MIEPIRMPKRKSWLLCIFPPYVEGIMSKLAIASAVVAKKALEKVVSDIYDYCADELKTSVQRWKTQAHIELLYKKLKNIRYVKTVWQFEREVDLLKFYYPTKIMINRKPVIISELDDFPYQGNSLIQGIVGRGKSIFLRYLTATELVQGRSIPLFIELRRIRESHTLIDHLLQEMNVLGLAVSEKVFRKICDEGKVILLLDAFDEIREPQKASLLSEIELLAKRYDRLRIIITSRPDSGIQHSPFLRVYEIAPLQGEEYEQVIDRLVQDRDVARRIKAGVSEAGENVSKLLTTPLMVSLLIVRFTADQSIPRSTVAFYEGLFDLLLLRHDRSKVGYIRARASNLGDTALEDIFNALCYLTRKSNEGTFTLADLRSYTREAAKIAGVTCDSDRVLDDFIRITCLILEEGGECLFVHKSVQEFHAARFVKDQPEVTASKFYMAMQDEKWRYWTQELNFLSMIDGYRYDKYFLAPFIAKLLALDEREVPDYWEPVINDVIRIFGRPIALNIGFDRSIQQTLWLPPCPFSLRGFTHLLRGYTWMRTQLLMNPNHLNMKGIFERAKQAGNGEAESVVVNLSEIINNGLIDSVLIDSSYDYLRQVFKELRKVLNTIQEAEAKRVLFEF